jgi:hypothetical protein
VGEIVTGGLHVIFTAGIQRGLAELSGRAAR